MQVSGHLFVSMKWVSDAETQVDILKKSIAWWTAMPLKMILLYWWEVLFSNELCIGAFCKSSNHVAQIIRVMLQSELPLE